jgi:hypothetical protein
MRVLGLRVKTGLAVGVIVAATRGGFKIERRVDMPLTDGDGKYARFPYHPLIELGGEAGVSASLEAVAHVQKSAARLIGAALSTLGPIQCATLVVGSLLAPDKIGNPHMRAHAREGLLYRTVLAQALDEANIANEFIEEKAVRSLGAAALKLTEAETLKSITAAGQGIIQPWRTDEKLAALCAVWKLRA